MDIAFLPEDRRLMRRTKLTKTTDNFNEDSFWLASVIKVPPRRDWYLYMANPKTTYSIIHRLDRSWKKNIKEHIEQAFRREFETLKEGGVNVGSYPEFLNEINFTTIPEEYFDTMDNFRLSKNNFKHLYYSGLFPPSYFVKDLAVDDMNYIVNTYEREAPLKPPWERIKEVFESYQDVSEVKEVSFEVNELALQIPEYEIVTTARKPKDLDNALPLMFDDTALFFKEPIKANKRRFERAFQRVVDYARPLIGTDDYTEKQKEQVQKLMDKASSYLTYEPAQYTGKYKELEIPQEMPENAVFVFTITLNTGYYPAVRQVAVSADMEFTDFDKLIAHLYRWGGFPYHLSEFIFPRKNNPEGKEASEILIWQEDDLPEELYLRPVDLTYLYSCNPFYNVPQSGIKGKKLKDYFPEFKTAQYRYDFGDNWYHAIELTGIYDQESFGKELPYLIESTGVAPMDDIGGPERFYAFMSRDYDYIDGESFQRIGFDWIKERELFLQAPCSLAPLFEN